MHGLHGHRKDLAWHGPPAPKREVAGDAGWRTGLPKSQNRRIGIPAHRPPYDRQYSAFSAVPEGCNRGNCSQVVTGRQSRLARSAPARSSCTAVCTCVHEKNCEVRWACRCRRWHDCWTGSTFSIGAAGMISLHHVQPSTA